MQRTVDVLESAAKHDQDNVSRWFGPCLILDPKSSLTRLLGKAIQTGLICETYQQENQRNKQPNPEGHEAADCHRPLYWAEPLSVLTSLFARKNLFQGDFSLGKIDEVYSTPDHY